MTSMNNTRKNNTRKNRSQALLMRGLCALALGLSVTAKADTIALTNSDALNTSSFDLAGNWSDGNAPAAGNAYQVLTNYTLRTPAAGGNNYAFAGDSLLIAGGADLRFKGANNDTITVSNLFFNNGIMDNGIGSTTFHLTGSLNLGSGGGLFDSVDNTRGISVDVAMGGSGPLTIWGAGVVSLTATNPFSGSTIVNDGILTLTGALTNGSGITINGSGTALGGSYWPLANARSGAVALEAAGTPFGGQPVTLNNGCLALNPPGSGGGMATIQTVVANSGWNDLGSQANSGTATLAISNLVRAAGATVSFRSIWSTLGQSGDNGAIAVTNLNGVPLANVNGILGGWAYAGNGNPWPGEADNFARLQSSGNGLEVAPASYTNTSTSTLANAATTDNVLASDSNNSDQTIAANKTVNSLITERDVIINPGTTLSLASGGIIMRDNQGDHWLKYNNNSTTSYITSLATNSSGTCDLFVNIPSNGGNMRFQDVTVVNNGSTPVNFIKSGFGTLRMHCTQGYTGKTILNGGTLLAIDGNWIFYNSSAILVNAGAILQADSNNTIEGTDSSGRAPITISAGGTMTTSSGVTAHIGGPLNLNGGTLASSTPSSQYGSWDLNQDIVAGGSLFTSTISATNCSLDPGAGVANSGGITFTVVPGALGTPVGSGIDLNVTGSLIGNGSLYKNGAGVMALASTNAYAGGTVVNAGTLMITGPGGSGWNSPAVRNALTVNSSATLMTTVGDALGGNSAKVNPLTLNGGTLTHTANGNLTFNSVTITNKGGVMQSVGGSGSFLDFYGGGTSLTIPATETNTAYLLGQVRLRQSNIPFVVQHGTASPDLEVDAVVSWTGEGNGALVKSGNGTMLMTAANTYTSPTIVNQGTLALGANASLASGSLVVASNSVLDASAISGGLVLNANQTLMADGTVQGSLSDNNNTVISPGSASQTAGTLTVNGNLTLNGSGSLTLDIGPTNTAGAHLNDLIVVNGNLTLNGGITVNFNFLNGSPALGIPYLVMTNIGTRTGGAYNFYIPSLGYTATFDDSNPHALYVTFTGLPSTLTWVGDGGLNQWDISTFNWSNNTTSVSQDIFVQADNVIFNDQSTNTLVDIALNVYPGQVHVTGTNSYTFVDTNSISGGATFLKDGSGSLTIGNPNTYSGATLVTGGLLIFSNNLALGTTASVTISNSAQFNVNGFDGGGNYYPFIVAGTGSAGAGLILNNGGSIYNNSPVGSLTLAANATVGGGAQRFDIGHGYAGQVLNGNNHVLTKAGADDMPIRTLTTNLPTLAVNGGRVWSQDADNNLGSNVVVAVGAGVGTWGTRNENASVTLNGGRLFNLGGGAGTWTGPITLTANSALDPGGNTMTLTAPVSGNYQLTQISGGTTITVASNSYSGGTVISNGTVQVGNNTAVGSILGPIAVYGYGTATYFRSDAQVITNPITGSGNMYYIGTNTIEFNAVNTGGTLGLGGSLGGATAVPATMFVNPGDAITVGILQLSAANVSPSAVVQSGGAIAATNSVVIGAWGWETSVFNLSGGQFEATNGTAGVTLGSTGNGVWNISGGVAEVSTITLNSGSDAYGGGYDALNLTNGILRIGAGGISSATQPKTASYLNLAGGTLGALASWSSTNAITLSGTPKLDSSTNTVTLAGVVSGSGGWVKQGTGALVLAGADTYAGTTTVSNGTLNLAGSIMGIGTGNITVEPAGTLTGTGLTAGSISVYGRVAPGAGVGTLSVANANLYGGGIYEFQLSSAINSSGWDLLYASGLINVQATSASKFTIKLVSMAGAAAGTLPDFDPTQNYAWTIATAGGALLNFDSSKFAVDAGSFSNAYTGTFAVTNSGNSVVVQYTAPVVTTPPTITGQQKLTDGTFSLTFSGTQNTGYSVRASTNLALSPVTNWPVISTGTFGTSSVTYTDANATIYPMRFYLITEP